MGHIRCLGGLSLAWPHAGWSKWGRRNEKERGAPWSGATGCRKSAARSLASRRQKARLCLAPAMTQGAKNYKIRQPPPFPGVKLQAPRLALHRAQTLNSITKATEAVCALQSRSPPASISFLSCHFRAQLYPDARFSVLYWEGKF